MSKKEANFDLFIYNKLIEAGIKATAQGSDVVEINAAFKHASKNQKGNVGYPEYTAIINDFVLIVEDKAEQSKLALYNSDQTLNMTPKGTVDYALNGAVWYAKQVIDNTTFKKIFVLANAGDETHHILKPAYVCEMDTVIELEEVETYLYFSPNNISEYYKEQVLKEKPDSSLKQTYIADKAEELYALYQNYGLNNREKLLTTAACYLVCQEPLFNTDMLKGDAINTDGLILYQTIQTALQRNNATDTKITEQFTFLKNRPELNIKQPTLGKTPLRFFTDFFNTHINKKVADEYKTAFFEKILILTEPEQTTPTGIEKLMLEFIKNEKGSILDPCAGIGNFVLAGNKKSYGIEKREDLYAVAVINNIIHKSNNTFINQNFFDIEEKRLPIATYGVMNPPWNDSVYPELSFVERMLEHITDKGVVLLPTSALTGNSKAEKALKGSILKKHTLEGVISLDRKPYLMRLYPNIVIFTANQPHQKDKKVKFINMIMDKEPDKDKKQYLFDCWNGKEKTVPSRFMVQTTITADDEWTHSYFYYNDEIPDERDFENKISDYMTFEFNMSIKNNR